MKKLILAAIATIAFSNVANARVDDQSRVEPDPIESIFGGETTQGQTWSAFPHHNHREWKHHVRHNTTYHSYSHNFTRTSPSLVAFGHMLQREGIRVSEHPAFGGVHHVHHGHGHYAGRAIDVNVGRGVVEARNASARRRFDRLAARARAAGYVVLWKVRGHFNHMHIEKRA